jgi:hypothetical protein
MKILNKFWELALDAKTKVITLKKADASIVTIKNGLFKKHLDLFHQEEFQDRKK